MLNIRGMSTAETPLYGWHCASVPSQDAQGGDSALAQALPGKQADLGFGLIQPTPVLGRVMDGKAVPDRTASFLAVIAGERLPAMNVPVIHHQVNRTRLRIAVHDRLQRLGKFGRGAVRGGRGEVPPGLRFHGAEDIGGAAPLARSDALSWPPSVRSSPLTTAPRRGPAGPRAPAERQLAKIAEAASDLRWILSPQRAVAPCLSVDPKISQQQYITESIHAVKDLGPHYG